MSVDREQPPVAEPLAYAGRRTPSGRVSRAAMVAALGALIAAAGVGLFFAAHRLTEANWLFPEHRQQHELLMAALAIAIVVVGGLVMVVGLHAWCTREPR